MLSANAAPSLLLTEREIERFLYYEARLVDEWRWDDWLSLYTEDATYWLPLSVESTDPRRAPALIYDTRQALEGRIWRSYKSGAGFSQEPVSRTRHFVSNIEITPVSDDEVTVFSNVAVVELRRGLQTTYAGRCEHRLRRQDGSWKIASKRVDLLNADEPLHNFSFFV